MSDSTNQNEMIRLYRIIKSSKRVKEARKLLGLINEDDRESRDKKGKKGKGENENVVNFENFALITTYDRKIPKIKGKRAMDFYYKNAAEFVQKNIKKYFGLKCGMDVIMDAIFKGRVVTRTFKARGRIVKPSNKFQIIIDFDRFPNANNRKLLWEKIIELLELVKPHIGEAAKERRKKALLRDERKRRIREYDKKLEKFISFSKSLDKKYPKGIPKNQQKRLVNIAERLPKNIMDEKINIKEVDFGIDMKPPSHSQIKRIGKFDERFEITQHYKKIKNSKLPKKKRLAQKKELVEYAKKLLGKKQRGFNESDLEKIVNNFEKQFGKV